MESTMDMKLIKSDHTKALAKVAAAEEAVDKAGYEAKRAQASYNELRSLANDEWDLSFAWDDVLLATKELNQALENLKAAQKLESIRAMALQRAKQASKAVPGTQKTSSDPLSPFLKNPWTNNHSARRGNNAGWESSKRLIKCARHYKGYKEKSRRAQCCVTGVWGQAETVVACPILPLRTTPFNIQARLQMKGKLLDLRNTMPILKSVEDAYNQQRLCIVLNEQSYLYQIRILDPSLKQQTVYGFTTFEMLECRSFDLPVGRDGRRPFARCLSFHAQASHARAVRKGWLTSHAHCPEEYGSPLGTDIIWFSETESESDSGVSDIED